MTIFIISKSNNADIFLIHNLPPHHKKKFKIQIPTFKRGSVQPPRKTIVNKTMTRVVVSKTLFTASFPTDICRAKTKATAPRSPIILSSPDQVYWTSYRKIALLAKTTSYSNSYITWCVIKEITLLVYCRSQSYSHNESTILSWWKLRTVRHCHAGLKYIDACVDAFHQYCFSRKFSALGIFPRFCSRLILRSLQYFQVHSSLRVISVAGCIL